MALVSIVQFGALLASGGAPGSHGTGAAATHQPPELLDSGHAPSDRLGALARLARPTHVPAGAVDVAPGSPAASQHWSEFLDRAGLRPWPMLGGLNPVDAAASEPAGLNDLFRRAATPGLPPLPIPAPPAGGEPLLAALQDYADQFGLPSPPLGELRASIAALRLQPETERALSQVVLAYVDAVRVQEEAIQGLTPGAKAWLGGDPDATAAWWAAHQGATQEDWEREAHSLLAAHVDFDRMQQAADLLTRTVDLVRGPLGLPATSPGEALEADTPPPQPPAAPDPWIVADAALSVIDPGHASADAAAALANPPTLAVSLEQMARALGLAEPAAAALPTSLPPTLDAALSRLVMSKTLGLESGDPAFAARLLVEATRESLPTLEAWGALLELDAVAARPLDRRDMVKVVAEALDPQVSASVLAAHAGGRSPPPPPRTPIPLATQLAMRGMSPHQASEAAAAVPPRAQAALSIAIAGIADLQAARQAAAQALSPQEQAALTLLPLAAETMQAETWQPEETAFLTWWARTLAGADLTVLDPMARARDRAMAAMEAAAALLSPDPFAPIPASAEGPPGSPSMETTTASSTCPVNLDSAGLSDCNNNVWLLLDAGIGGVVVTNGPSTVGNKYFQGHPTLILDLGGDTTYAVPAGGTGTAYPFFLGGFVDARALTQDLSGAAATQLVGAALQRALAQGLDGQAVSVVLDVAGDDHYTSAQPEGLEQYTQGSAHGIGTLGILIDLAGNDRYEHDGAIGGSQGFGALGGLGLLLDAGGSDTFTSGGLAQGVATTGSFEVAQGSDSVLANLGGATGLLLAVGLHPRDRYNAQEGQGFSQGPGTVGLLLDSQGDTSYAVTDTSPYSQGGRAPGVSSAAVAGLGAAPSIGLGALIDLGGRDSFSNTQAESGPRGPGQVWRGSAESPFGFGLSLSASDSDGDGYQDVVEGLAGSDPRDDDDVPSEGVARTLSELSGDEDHDGMPDALEGVLGWDPFDPDNSPTRPGHLLAVRWPCFAADGCAGDADLFALGGSGTDAWTRPAVVQVDLGGQDVYAAEVAGPANVTRPDGSRFGFGSLAVDVRGNDVYDTPARSKTQGSAWQGASLLVDAEGDDVYRAGACSQGSSCGPPSVGILLDLTGDDRYESFGAGQGFASSGGSGVLADVAGDDFYVFDTQAFASGAGGVALMLDVGDGHDDYNGTRRLDLGPDVADACAHADPSLELFSMQGNNATGTAAATVLYLDDSQRVRDDVYWANIGGSVMEVTACKNDWVRTQTQAGILSVFADNPALGYAGGDWDGEDSPNAVEFLVGTDARDDDDQAGTVLEGNPDVEGGDPWLNAPRPGGGLSPLSNVVLPGLVIGGRGNTTYDRVYGLIADLDGSNRYTASGVGGASSVRGTESPFPNIENGQGPSNVQRFVTSGVPAGISLIIDAGDRDTQYAPAPYTSSRITTKDQDQAVNLVDYQPTLAGAVLGISVLADFGGHNEFTSSTTVLAQANDDLQHWPVTSTAYGVAQGAAILGGIGVLATWDSTNEFTASTTAHALDFTAAAEPGPVATVRGVCQGAAWDGIGILATFGTGNDTYRCDAEPVFRSQNAPGSGEGRAWAVAQGAGGPYGTGVLHDAGGPATFYAPAGLSQGAALRPAFSGLNLETRAADLPVRSPHGVLWKGPGNDRYVGGSLSQGAAVDLSLPYLTIELNASKAPVGLLVDAGGDDEYGVFVEDGASAVSQGASFEGAGALVDLGGSDRWDAPGASDVQGSARRVAGTHSGQGAGLLWAVGGHDSFVAESRAQGFGEADATGLLVKVDGSDYYRLDAQGQGHGARGLFVDAGGLDVYDYDPANKVCDPCQADGNGMSWTQSSGRGVDDATLSDAMTALFDTSGPLVGAPRVTLDVADAEGPVVDGQPADGVVTLTARVTGIESARVRRVDFVLNDQVLGTVYEPTGDDHVLVWDATPASVDGITYPDGAYSVYASAFIAPESPTDAAFTPHDFQHEESETREIVLSNPPIAEATLAWPHPGGFSPALGQTGTLTVDVSSPAVVKVTAERMGSASYVAFNGTTQQSLVLPLDGTAGCSVATCPGGGRWPDGTYELTVEVRGVAGGTALVLDDLPPFLVDATPPSSAVTVPSPWSNSTRQANPQGTAVSVEWTAHDDGIGLATVDLFRVNATGGVLESWLEQPPDTTSRALSASRGQPLRLVTTATDAFGNAENRSAKPIVETTIDFEPPKISNVSVEPGIVRPNQRALFRAEATDPQPGSGVQAVFLRADGGPLVPMILNATTGQFVAEYRFTVAQDTERSYGFEILALDVSGNSALESFDDGRIDGVRPHVEPLETTYEAPPDGAWPEGRAGGIATIRFLATDTVTARALAGAVWPGAAAASCSEPVSPDDPWACPLPVPTGIPDGSYDIHIEATDAAGNANVSQNATVVVHSAKLQLSPPVPVDIGFSSALVNWTTSEGGEPALGTSRVDFAKTGNLGPPRAENATFAANHSVLLEGLEPSTNYFLQAMSRSRAGVSNTSSLVTFRTASALNLTLSAPGAILNDTVNVTLALDLRGADVSPAHIELFIEDAEGASDPTLVAESTRAAGPWVPALNTTPYADGPYRLVARATRGSDETSLAGPTFHIINAAPVLAPQRPLPDSFTNLTRPLFQVAVLHPGAPDPPPLADAELAVDGVIQDLTDVTLSDRNATTTAWTLVFRPSENLTDGHHEASLRLRDVVGHASIARWELTVDTTPPTTSQDPVVLHAPGPHRARPLGNVSVLVNLTDVSGVAQASLNTSSLGGVLVPMAQTAQHGWQVNLTVPGDLADGEFALPIMASDGLGNHGPAGLVLLVVDGTAPGASQVRFENATTTSVQVAVELSEPAKTLLTFPNGTAAGASTEFLPSVRFHVTGLTPGVSQRLNLRMVDGAGNEASRAIEARTLADDEPPSPPPSATAESRAEGQVHLAWQPATDNVAIALYQIERTHGDAFASFSAPANSTAFLDHAAPAGVDATYHLYSVDLGGLRSDALNMTVRVLAFPHLFDGRLGPDEGTSSDPFEARVHYRHPAGILPERVEAVMAGEATLLVLQSAASSCRTGCVFAGNVSLPPTSQLGAARNLTFQAQAGHDLASLTLEELPLVLAPDAVDPPAVPGPGFVALALGILAVTFASAGWRRRL